MNWMLMPFRRYADFSGRSRRMEYWMFKLFNFLVLMVALLLTGIVGAIGGNSGEPSSAVMVIVGLMGLYILATIIPSLSASVRRFHDQGKSGWFVLLGFIPGVGGLIILVFMCLEGERGRNQYGEDPKQVSAV